MATLIIESMAFDFPDVDLTGQPADAFGRAYLNALRLARLQSRMIHWLSQQAEPPTPTTFQAELWRQAQAFVFRDVPRDDQIETEARELALDDLLKRLAALDLPLPRNAREHAEQLVANDPRFRAEAKRRVEARTAAAREVTSSLLTAEAEPTP